MPLPSEERKYTYADYLTWPEGERWEIEFFRLIGVSRSTLYRYISDYEKNL